MSGSESVGRLESTPLQSAGGNLALEDRVGIVLMVLILIAMSLGVFFRYVLNNSLTWSEEVARYGLIAMTFIGCATAVRRGSHVRIDLVDLLLPPNALFALKQAINLLSFAFLTYAAFRTWQIMGFLASSKSPAMQIPINTIYALVFAGFTLAAIRQLLAIIRALRAGAPR